MTSTKYFVLFAGLLTFNHLSYADHPNEGKIAMAQLITEAEVSNLEIKAAQENLAALKTKYESQWGRFAPKLSIEGGPQTTRLDNDKTDSTSIYGKAEWNLYSGGSDVSSLDSLKSQIETQERALATLKSKTKNEIAKAYYELQFILESISLKQKALDLNSQQMKIAKVKNSSGLTSNSDVLEFDLRESTLQSDLVLLNQQLDQKSRELDVILSKPNDTSLVMVKGHLEKEELNYDRSELLTKAQKNNEQILLSKLERLQIQNEKKQATSQFLPRLDFEAKYGKLASEEKSYKETDNYTLALKVKIPLFSGLEDYKNSKSINSKIKAIDLSINQKNITIASQIDTVLAEIKALKTRLNLEEKNLERSEKYYRYTLEEYKRGIKNSPDMVGASERVLEARIRNLEYRRDLMLAKSKISTLIGE